MATLKEIFEGNTADILEATELLKVLGDREGQFVWKKYAPLENNLPEGYTRVTHIESTGTQFINTHIKPNQTTKLIMGVQFTDSSDSETFAFGTRDGAKKNSYLFGINPSNKTYRLDYATSQLTNNSLVSDPCEKRTVTLESGVLTQSTGESLSATQEAFQCSYDLYLFAVNLAGTVDLHSSTIVDTCQIWHNGVLARNYVSCINPSGKAGLYDMVEGTFEGNVGTGEFIGGETLEFVGYVTADNENSYPNDGELDGYWYEKVEGGTPYTGANPLTIGEAGATIPANTLLETALQIVNGVKAGITLPSSYTKFAVDEFTFSSNTNIYQSGNPWKHSLGVIPKAIIVLGEPAKDSNVNAISRIIVDTVSTTTYAWVGIARLKNGYNNPSGSIVNLTNTTFNFQYNGSSSHYFASGVKYTIITMA